MGPEQQLVYDNLSLLLNNQVLKTELGSDEFYALTDQVEAMKDRYQVARELADKEGADAKQKEYAKNVCASTAKGLPDITKAAISAAAAFKKGDSITGSAVIMDLCAAVAPYLDLSLAPELCLAPPPVRRHADRRSFFHDRTDPDDVCAERPPISGTTHDGRPESGAVIYRCRRPRTRRLRKERNPG